MLMVMAWRQKCLSPGGVPEELKIIFFTSRPDAHSKQQATSSQSQLNMTTERVCRVAIIGAHRQRVARVVAIIHADESLASVDTLAISSSVDPSSSQRLQELPSGVPPEVMIEYLPCVATFDSYEDDNGESVRYLAKLEYHGPNGTLVNGKTLAPFFDQNESNDDDDEIQNPFPGIAGVAIGCGVDTNDDFDKVKSFMESLSSSCITEATDVDINMIVECIQPNPEFTSMKEENDCFRDMSDDMKREAVVNRTIGPGKMAIFAYKVAEKAVQQRWGKELLTDNEPETDTQDVAQTDGDEEATELVEIEAAPHFIDPEKIRYACKRCRSVLFSIDDLEDPPHAQSLHNFRRKGQTSNQGMCQNLFIADPLPWMNGCNETEGKLHCPKCQTKVGHYAWTGAQCSCGTWVTPAIMVPVSKVDEMKPASQNIIATSGPFVFAQPSNVMVQNQS
eukprot:scaffold19268_cov148-Skeletonema_menzelii.AAC.8